MRARIKFHIYAGAAICNIFHGSTNFNNNRQIADSGWSAWQSHEYKIYRVGRRTQRASVYRSNVVGLLQQDKKKHTLPKTITFIAGGLLWCKSIFIHLSEFIFLWVCAVAVRSLVFLAGKHFKPTELGCTREESGWTRCSSCFLIYCYTESLPVGMREAVVKGSFSIPVSWMCKMQLPKKRCNGSSKLVCRCATQNGKGIRLLYSINMQIFGNAFKLIPILRWMWNRWFVSNLMLLNEWWIVLLIFSWNSYLCE